VTNEVAKNAQPRPESRTRAYISGLGYPLRAAKLLISNFSLLKYAILPIIINTVIFIAVFFVGGHFWGSFIQSIEPAQQAWYLAAVLYVLWVAAWVLGFVVYLLLCFLLFTVIGNIVAAPFLDILSKRTEKLILGKKGDIPFSFKILVRDLGALLAEELLKFLAWLSVMIGLAPLLLIPVVGQLGFMLLSALFTVYFLGMAFADFPLARRRQPFSAKRKFAWRVRYRLLGMGTAIYATLVIPIVGFVCLPLSTVAATILFCEYASDEEKRFIIPKDKAISPPALEPH